MKRWIVFFLISTQLFGFYFERRDQNKTYNAYYVYPLALEMPGLGQAFGVGVIGNNLMSTDMDLLALHMEGDFNLDIVSAIDIPLYRAKDYNINLSPAYLNFEDGTVEMYQRGRDSKKEDKYYFDTNQFTAKGLELSLQYYDSQLEFYAGYTSFYADPKSIRDELGNELADNIGDVRSSIYRTGIYVDDTDSRRDPRVGYRVQYERMGILNKEKKFGDGYQEDISLTAFIPMQSHNHILVANYFFSAATITREGEVDPNDYLCDPADLSCDQSIYDEVRLRREAEVKKGNATSLGGTQRMRAYPQGRFYDTYTTMIGLEYRWYLLNYWKPFDNYLWRGVNTGLQVAFFQEFGQVSENNDHTLYEDMKSSTGVGLRILFNTMVVRIDVATGEEGSQTTFFYGYSF
jgi:hypothetical protein